MSPARSFSVWRASHLRATLSLVFAASSWSLASGQALWTPGGTVGNNATNSNVGIGTSTPFAKLAVEQSGGEQIVARYNSGNPRGGIYTGGNSASNFVGHNLTFASANIFNYDKSGFMWFIGDPAGANKLFIGTGSGTAGAAAGTGDSSSVRVTIDDAGRVGIGTTSPTHKLAVNGTIRAKEVIVDTGWADHVFAADYRLAPLSEVEQHIQQNGRLPDVPSAADVAARGVSVGEMQKILLQKIEELTLHAIRQQKLLSEQQEEIAALRAELRPSTRP